MRILGLLALVFVITVGSAAGSAGGLAAAPAPVVFPDATGDAASAPDITQVKVVAGSGTVGFHIAYAGGFDPDAAFLILLDTDRNPQTGDSGADYFLELDLTGAALEKWDGTQWLDASHQPLTLTLSSSEAAVTVALADIGSPAAFDVVIGSLKGDDLDVVPDAGTATYTVPAAVTVKALLLPATVLAPKAGAVFRVPRLKVLLSDGTSPSATRQACTLEAQGKKLPALVGGCAWKLPKSSRGRRLTLTVSFAYGDDDGSTSWPIVPR